MLKKSNAGRAGGANGGGQADMRLLKVLEVSPEGMVVKFTDGKAGPETVFMEAMPAFVEQKNKSVNFAKKSTGDKMDPLFYAALMRPTTNPLHQFYKNLDIISAKVFPRQGTKTVEGHGELTKVGLGGGFTIFARGDNNKPDTFDSSITVATKGDQIMQGFGRIVHDKDAENTATGKKGVSWLEVLVPKGNPTDLNTFADEVRELVSQKKGKNIFVRIVDEAGANDSSVSFYPGKPIAQVEDEIQEIKNLNLPLERIFVWDIQSRVYLREDFLIGQGDNPSKLMRFRRDAEYTYRINPEKTPYEVDAVDVKNGATTRRTPAEGYLIPIAVSLTMYQNASTQTEWLPGSIRAMVPIGNEALHSRQMFMTPAQRALAATLVPADMPMDDSPAAPEGDHHASQSSAKAPAADLDFGFGEAEHAA